MPKIDPAPSPRTPEKGPSTGWRHRWHEVIFEADTRAGKLFDVILLLLITASLIAVMLDSLETFRAKWSWHLRLVEWGITLLFTLEYLARLACVERPGQYATSFFGMVDLLALLPSYLGVFIEGTGALTTVRTLRLLRVFRVFKMGRHLSEGRVLLEALKQTRTKITVFLSVVACAITILGTVMYVIEGTQPDSPFDSIPRSLYWAVVTMTTVGYGDIAPQTVMGQAVAALTMLFGYSVIIVPTGIFSAEVMASRKAGVTTQACRGCSREGHDTDARYCKYCGMAL
jgi:voltage-gated potassium channel